jgi:hypothetical protein
MCEVRCAAHRGRHSERRRTAGIIWFWKRQSTEDTEDTEREKEHAALAY